MTEAQIQTEILTGLKSEFPALIHFRVLSGIIRANKNYIHGAPKGTPDICGYLPDGRFLGIECKTPGGDVKQEQYDFAVAATRAGAVVFQASSWDDCKRKLMEAMKCQKRD